MFNIFAELKKMNALSMLSAPSNGLPLVVCDLLDRVQVTADLNGCHGSNRAFGNRPQIAANTDIEAIKAWLARFVETPTTFENYRKEAERLVLWSTITLGKPISSLTHEDLLAYQRFLTDPQPAPLWVMPRGRKVARAHPDWRPFSGPLAPSSQRQAIVILNALFSWLVHAGYLAGNPLSLSRQRTRRVKPRVTRYLEPTLWAEVKHTIHHMPQTTDREREHHRRVRWLFSLLYLCGLRISEVVDNSMASFFCRRDADGRERWWLEITGKGSKTRIVPATHELMAELTSYRQKKNLSPYPWPGETTPLLLPINNRNSPMTRGAVHVIVKKVFQHTAQRLRARDEVGQGLAERLDQASAHWLRHTAGSHMANQALDLRHVRDNLGHESISTTSDYLHVDDDARHKETEAHHTIGW
jgi:integrase/recombinase XerD